MKNEVFMTNGWFDVQVKGIPAKALVTNYYPGDDGGPDCPPSEELVEWILCDRRGYRARWLEDKLTDSELDAVHDQVVDELHKHQRRERAEAELAAGELRGEVW